MAHQRQSLYATELNQLGTNDSPQVFTLMSYGNFGLNVAKQRDNFVTYGEANYLSLC
jgi:hypothetical protein